MENKEKEYIELILAENQRQNLVSRRNTRSEIEKHIKDSIAIFDFVSLSGKNLIDIGSGAGFPGMVLAIMSGTTRVTLVESDTKKGAFLMRVKEALDIDNVEIIIKRVEEIGHKTEHREQYDFCCSRAVAPLRTLLEYSLPLIKPEGLAIMWKGRNYNQEIIEAENAMVALGAQVETVIHYNLMDEYDRSLIVVKKKFSTPYKYPRRVGVPGKRPL